ncbi:MAG TPA: COX15/CtaA family protein [Oligoflexia bacterium]|nr:COX15/CtaA family protein [Oligoflexia bacterium]HMP27374.1 COX15/CtaA family protein [Oligoflexia bacterium]
MNESSSKSLYYFSLFSAVYVAFLIFVGALVKSHEAGLAVPDWPTTYGENMFTFPISKWVGPVFYEHFHRLAASFAGILTIVLTIWIWLKENRRWVREVVLAALFAVILQGLLGGLTVIYKLPILVSSAHGSLGQFYFLLVLTVAFSQSPLFARLAGSEKEVFSWRLFILSFFFWGLIFVQLTIGALQRHGEAGLAVLDFPTVAGSWLPTFSMEMIDRINIERMKLGLLEVDFKQVAIHLLHRYLGFVIFLFWLFISFSFNKKGYFELRSLRTVGRLLTLAIVLQIALGANVIWFLREPWLTSAHVFLGALILGLSCLFCLIQLTAAKIIR